MILNVAMIVPQTEAEGPGRRYAIWVQGCPMRCPGCCNPEMLDFRPADLQIEPSKLIEEACAADVEGVSFLGGEPFAHAEGLALVAEGVRARGLSVMVFSGYTLAELSEMSANNDPGVARLLAASDLLVDGRYEQNLRTLNRRWIGSTNQTLHFLTARYSADDPRFAAPNTIELRIENGRATLNGFPISGSRTRF
jgi:anaerobic ribonucleoside-triphosphate reductase activating protein